jgi:hypothetical protein
MSGNYMFRRAKRSKNEVVASKEEEGSTVVTLNGFELRKLHDEQRNQFKMH